MAAEPGSAAAEWAAARWVTVRGAPLRYRAAGRGAAVVLVHGLGMSADYWVRVGPALAEAGFRAVAPDLPGFGRTPGPAEGLPIGAQSAALQAFCDAMRLEPAVFVGHSLSCESVLCLASEAPHRVRGLVLAAPVDGGSGGLPFYALRLLRDVWREPPLLVPYVARAWLQAGPRRFLGTWRSGTRHDSLALLPNVAAPGIVVVGSRDPVVEPEFARALADGLPRGALVTVSGAAHGIVMEPTGGFRRAILDFVRSLETH